MKYSVSKVHRSLPLLPGEPTVAYFWCVYVDDGLALPTVHGVCPTREEAFAEVQRRWPDATKARADVARSHWRTIETDEFCRRYHDRKRIAEEDEWRRLMRERITAGPLFDWLAVLHGTIGDDTECLWWSDEPLGLHLQLQLETPRPWVRCPILERDDRFVYVWFGREPVRLDASNFDRGLFISGVVDGVFYTDAGREERKRRREWMGGFSKGAAGGASALAALGLSAGASLADVKRAFRERVKTAHPDQGGSPDAFMALERNYRAAVEEVRA